MEEEIPTGLLMLRMIPKKSLKSKFPKMKFWRFLFSAAVRIVMGYIFLLNMFLVVVQATAVIGEIELFIWAIIIVRTMYLFSYYAATVAFPI